MGALKPCLLVLIVLLGALTLIRHTTATHNHFGTISAEYDPIQDVISYQFLQAWRVGYWSSVQVGSALKSGVVCSGEYVSMRANSSNQVCRDFTIIPRSIYVDPLYRSDQYFFGDSDYTSTTFGLTNPGKIASSVIFYSCCRVSILGDTNNDRDVFHWLWHSPGVGTNNYRRYTPSSSGFPREFIEYKQLTAEKQRFKVAAVARGSPTLEFSFPITRTKTDNSMTVGPQTKDRVDRDVYGTSGLYVQTPCGMVTTVKGNNGNGNGNGGTRIEYDSSNCNRIRQLTTASTDPANEYWKVLRLENKNDSVLRWSRAGQDPGDGGYLSYAISVEITDNQLSNTATGKISITVDFMFIVIRPCPDNDSSCNHPPRFRPYNEFQTVIATVPFSTTFKCYDIDPTDTVETQNAPSSDPSMIFTHTNQRTVEAWLTVSWTTDIDSPSSVACMKCSDSRSLISLNSDCPRYIVTLPPYMFVSGVLRDFDPTPHQMDRLTAPLPPSTYTLDSNSKILMTPNRTPTSSEVSVASFNNWWDDAAAVSSNLYAMVMIRYYNNDVESLYPLGTPSRAQRVFSFQRTNWLPVNELDGTDPKVTPNYYYTYEAQTKFDLLETEVLDFSAKGGELFVFMAGKLIVNLHDSSTSITGASIRAAVGPYVNVDGSGKASSYDVNLFYVNRQDSPTSSFSVNWANSTACSAINVLRTSSYASLLAKATIFDFDANSSKPFSLDNWSVQGSSQIVNNNLRLLSSSQFSTSAAIWYNPSAGLQKVLSGFEASFSFTLSPNANGVAFVVQSSSPTAKGSDGAGLGYSGIKNGIAIEFDSTIDPSVDINLSSHHISAHISPPNGALSSIESEASWPPNTRPETFLSESGVFFTNSSRNDVRIEFASGSSTFWMYVYLNKIIKPVYVAQFSRETMLSMFADGAFVGLTTSNTGSKAGDVDISAFKFIVIPPSAEKSAPSGSAYTALAGQVMRINVDLHDVCGEKLYVKGEKSRFFGKFVHQNSFVPLPATGEPDENQVYDTIIPTVEDLGAGSYAFSAVFKRSGKYNLFLYLTEPDLNPGEGQPLGQQRISQTDLWKIPQKTAQISPGVDSPLTSYYTLTQITPSLDNTHDTAFFTATDGKDGIACMPFYSDARLITNIDGVISQGRIFTTTAAYNLFKNNLATSHHGVCVVVGKQNAQTIAIINTETKPTTAYTLSHVVSAVWAIDGTRSRVTTGAISSILTAVKTKITIDSATYYVESAGTSASGVSHDPSLTRGMILNHPLSIEYPTNSNGIIHLHLKDRFGNSVTSATSTVTFAFSPTLLTNEPYQLGPKSPFYALPFETASSGRFAFSVSTEYQIGQNGQLIVLSGAAHFTTSVQSGVTVGGIVDNEMTFDVTLFDINSNQVLTQSVRKTEITKIEWVSVTDNSYIPYTMTAENSQTATDPYFYWNPALSKYQIKYTPKFAGLFFVKIYVNGNEMISSKGLQVSILAGPLHHHSLVNETVGDAPFPSGPSDAPFPIGTYTAGEVNYYRIQSTDKYGNYRYSYYDNGSTEFRIQFYEQTNKIKFSSAELGNYIDLSQLSASEYTSGNDFISFQYQGNGVFTSRFIARSTTIVEARVVLYNTVSKEEVPISANVVVSPGKNEFQAADETDVAYATRHTPAVWSVVATPGHISSKSIFSILCAPNTPCTNSYAIFPVSNTDVDNIRFTFQPRDRYDNIITTTATEVAKVLNVRYETSSADTTVSFYRTGSINSFESATSTSNLFTGGLSSDSAGTYLLYPVINTEYETAEPQYPSEAQYHTSFVLVPGASDIDVISNAQLIWPTAIQPSKESIVSFVDFDSLSNSRQSLHMSYVPVTPFTVYTSPDSGATCVSDQNYSCTPSSSGRPFYECKFTLDSGSTSVRVFISTGCAVTAGSCPIACSTYKDIDFVDNGNTNAKIEFVQVGDVTQSDPVPVSWVEGDNNWGHLSSATAGTPITVYIFDYTDSGQIVDMSGTGQPYALQLAAAPGSIGSFATLSKTPVSCNDAASVNPKLASMCMGRGDARLYVFVLNYTTLLSYANNKFAIFHLAMSSVNSNDKYYSIEITPTTFNPKRSVIQRVSNPSILAGENFEIVFFPLDNYGNGYHTLSSFPQPDITQFYAEIVYTATATFDQFSSMVDFCTFTPYPAGGYSIVSNQPLSNGIRVTNAPATPTGYVKCIIPGAIFTKAGTKVFYVAATTNPLVLQNAPIATKISDYAVQSYQNAVLILANQIYLPNTAFSLMSVTNGGWATSLAPSAGSDFSLYAFPRDKYNNIATDMTTTNDNIILQILDQNGVNQIHVPSTIQWTKSPASTPSNAIFVTTIQSKVVSRYGMQFSASSTTHGTSSVYILYVRSGLLVQNNDNIANYSPNTALYTQSDQKLTQEDTQLTIDDLFEFTLKVFDVNGNGFVYNLGDGGDDISLINAKFEFHPAVVSAENPIKALSVTLVSQKDPNNPTKLQNGVFTLSTLPSSYSHVGKYVLSISIQSTQIIGYIFQVSPGSPHLDFTAITSMGQFSSNAVGVIKFQLYDRLNNLINRPLIKHEGHYASETTANPLDALTAPRGGPPSTTLADGYVSISFGVRAVTCGDFHGTVNPLDLYYQTQQVTPLTNPFFKLALSYNTETHEYSAWVTPSPTGVYSLNFTYVQNTIINGVETLYPTSYLSCGKAASLFFKVDAGLPFSQTSSYTVTALSGSALSSPNSGYAGDSYSIDLVFRDMDDGLAEQTTKVYPFFDPNIPSSITLVTALYKNPTTDDPANTNLVSLTATDMTQIYQQGRWSILFSPKIAGNYEFAIFIDEVIDGVPQTNRVVGHQSIQHWTTLHGTPTTAVISGLPTGVVLAGNPITFYITAYDAWSNSITSTDKHSLIITVSRDASTLENSIGSDVTGLMYTIPSRDVVMDANGVTTVVFTPAYEGLWSITVSMMSKDSSKKFLAEAKATNLQVLHSTCAGQYLALHPGAAESEVPTFRCASSETECVMSYSQCSNPKDRVTCGAGQYLNSDDICHSLDGAIVDGVTYVKCPDGTFRSDEVSCIPPTNCPSGTYACPNDPTQCRSTPEDCILASQLACPAGTIICPNQLTCANNLASCPTIPPSIYTDCAEQGGIVCSSGICVSASSECPSIPQCPVGMVKCLTDGSCRTSSDYCPILPDAAHPTIDHCRVLYGTDAVLCPTGRDCAPSYANCPSSISCPIGFVLCALNNECKTSLSQCYTDILPGTDDLAQNGGLYPNSNVFMCSATEIRCPSTGVCVQNIMLCPSAPVCGEANPVLCSDSSCVTSTSLCPSGTGFSSCESLGLIKCSSSSQCVQTLSQCAVPIRCSDVNRSILCSSGTCAANSSECPMVLPCTSATPFRCSDHSCRSDPTDCPSMINCPPDLPVLCEDHASCVIASDMCVTETSTGAESESTISCGDMFKCPSGHCSFSALTCPTIVTCPEHTIRCVDGSCRKLCDSVNIISCPSLGLITCPASTSGVTCATSLINCPQGVTCGRNTPVKCIDATCALSADQCPPIPSTNPPANLIACSDGSFAYDACPTSVTCPSIAPIKCQDGISCVQTLEQCSPLPPCDQDSNTPYRCASGACSATPWDCRPSDPTICPITTPIKCPLWAGKNDCVKAIRDCPIVKAAEADSSNTGGGNDTGPGTNGDPKHPNAIQQPSSPVSDSAIWYQNPCPVTFTYCHDHTCVESLSNCPAYICPMSLSHLCKDGSCASDSSKCPNYETGCPWDIPIRCPGVGNCVAKLRHCQKPNCPPDAPNACSDGSCRSSCDNRQANGCRVNEFRCFDGSCVADAGMCTSAGTVDSSSGYINMCPPGMSFKCSNGLCVEKESVCPQIDTSTACPVDKPILCASGLCTSSTELCPLIKPCPNSKDYTRCDNGECKLTASESCPSHQSCPTGWVRCKQSDSPEIAILDGICAPSPDQCPLSNGCAKATPFKCRRNGRCVADNSFCSEQLPITNGCPSSTPFKCWNGACVSHSSACFASTNCPSVTSFRCSGSGRCVAKSSDCTAEDLVEQCLESDGKYRCPSGECTDNPLQCTTPFGCPVYAPVRCANGQCKRFSAEYRSPMYQLTDEQINSLTCPPVVQCAPGYIMCGNGKCVVSDQSCPSSPYTCETGLYACLDGTCRPSSDKCGFIQPIDEETQLPLVDENGDAIWIPSSTKSNCPHSAPLICPNGQCTADIAHCDYSYDIAKTTLAGSPTSSKPNSTLHFQVLCHDGNYRTRYSDCQHFAKKVNDMLIAAGSEDALNCLDYCPNGQCLLASQNAQQVCGVLQACPVGQWRCFDGQCSKTPCTAERPHCPAGQEANIDGQCRTIGHGLMYDGCSAESFQSHMCRSRECSSGQDTCTAAGTRFADDYAKLLLSESDFAKWKKSSRHQMVLLEGSAMDTSDHVEDDMILINAVSLFDVSNPIIHDFTQYNLKEIINTASTTYKSCTSKCVAQSKLTSTSILYNPSEADQQYTIGPLSTGFSMKLYSGIQVNQTGDLNIYIQPVGENVYFNASNTVTYSRRGQFGEALTAAQTVLSPVFSCSVGNGLVEPFAVDIELTSLIDRTMYPSPAPRDVCLARLRRFPLYNYAIWECIFTEDQRLQGGQYSVRLTDSQPIRQVVGKISTCYDPDLSSFSEISPYNVLQTNEDSRVPAVYAFIHSPLANDQVYGQSLDTFLRDNIIWIMFTIISGLLLLFVLIYTIMRLSRYSKKTEKTNDQIVEMEKEVCDMEKFGQHKIHDQELAFVANPLANTVKAETTLTDSEKLEHRQRKAQGDIVEAQERKDYITQLEVENQRQLEYLSSLKHKVGSSKGPKTH